jgi:hypothetical protein
MRAMLRKRTQAAESNLFIYTLAASIVVALVAMTAVP